jgi:hypothetical protein
MKFLKVSILLLFFLFFFTKASSQSGVNVLRIEIDSLDSSFINKEVKIIFKTGPSKENYHWYFNSKGKIKLKGKEIELISSHGRGTDYWYFGKAYLESENYTKDLTLRIYECIVKEISKDSIKFQWKLQYYKETEITDYEKCIEKKNHVFKYNMKKSKCLTEIDSEITEVSISKEIIKNILIRKYN